MDTCVRGGAVQIVGLSGLFSVAFSCVYVCVWSDSCMYMCIIVTWWACVWMCQSGCYGCVTIDSRFVCVCKWWWMCACMYVCVCLKPTLIQHSYLLVDFTLQGSFLSCIISPILLLNSLLNHPPKHTYSRVLSYKTKSFPHLFLLQFKFLKDCYTLNSTSSPPIYSSTHFKLAPIPTSLWKST